MHGCEHPALGVSLQDIPSDAAVPKKFRTVYSYLKSHCLCVAKDESQCESRRSALCPVPGTKWQPQRERHTRGLNIIFNTACYNFLCSVYGAFHDISLEGVIPEKHTLHCSRSRGLTEIAVIAVRRRLWPAWRHSNLVWRATDGRWFLLQSFMDIKQYLASQISHCFLLVHWFWKEIQFCSCIVCWSSHHPHSLFPLQYLLNLVNRSEVWRVEVSRTQSASGKPAAR